MLRAAQEAGWLSLEQGWWGVPGWGGREVRRTLRDKGSGCDVLRLRLGGWIKHGDWRVGMGIGERCRTCEFVSSRQAPTLG